MPVATSRDPRSSSSGQLCPRHTERIELNLVNRRGNAGQIHHDQLEIAGKAGTAAASSCSSVFMGLPA